ncbi:MAG: nucleotide exchange factor GrpE [Acidobacteriota bacterium]|nr:nucleotide exchange factor GrpE [Acidobacteriota bacterium]
MNDSKPNSARIPIRFLDDIADDDPDRQRNSGGDDDDGDDGVIDMQVDEPDAADAVNLAEPMESHAETESGADQQSAAESSGVDAGAIPGAVSGPLMAELVATRAELRRVETQLQNITDEHQQMRESAARRQADFDNYRKRVERERIESYQRTAGEVAGRLLPVVDNLHRALAAETFVQKNESEEFRHFLHGVDLISKQLSGVLEALGVETVATVGEAFDPHIHEAVAVEETDRYAPDTVIEEMVRGYRLGDKLLRPAMVKVAK